jgi:hypothetical protein
MAYQPLKTDEPQPLNEPRQKTAYAEWLVWKALWDAHTDPFNHPRLQPLLHVVAGTYKVGDRYHRHDECDGLPSATLRNRVPFEVVIMRRFVPCSQCAHVPFELGEALQVGCRVPTIELEKVYRSLEVKSQNEVRFLSLSLFYAYTTPRIRVTLTRTRRRLY